MPLRLLARTKAQKYGIDPDIFERQIRQESSFRPDAYNPKSGASGIAQLMPQFYPNVDPYDPDQALDAAASSVASYRKMYGSDDRKALSAYNYGPGNLNKLVGQYGEAWEQYLPSETKQYLSVVLPTGRAPGDVKMASYGNMAPGYRPLWPVEELDDEDKDEDDDDDDDLDLKRLLGKSPKGVTYGPPQKDEYGRIFRMGSNGKPSYDLPPPKPPKPTVTAGGKIQEWIGAYIQATGRAPSSEEIQRKLSGAPKTEYSPTYVDISGREYQFDSRGKKIYLPAPPKQAAPKLGVERGTDPQTGRRYTFNKDTGNWEWIDEAPKQRFAEANFETDPETGKRFAINPSTGAVTEIDERMTEPNVWKDPDTGLRYSINPTTGAPTKLQTPEQEELDRLVKQAQIDHDRATIDYQNAQLEATRLYQQGQLEQARATLEENKRQFEITEARLRAAQAEQEKQNRINNMFEASERTGLVSSGILNLGNNAPGYEERIGILSGYQR